MCMEVCNVENMKVLPIPGFPAYRIREDGQIETNWRTACVHPGSVILDAWRVLPPRCNAKGYRAVYLSGDDGMDRRAYIHCLVLEVFKGPRPSPQHCARHLDGDNRNNFVDNLAWGTYKENEDDKALHGTHGDRFGGAKLTPEDKATILRLRSEGWSMKSIGKEVGVTHPTVSRFLNGRTWTYTTPVPALT